MFNRSSIGVVALAASLSMASVSAKAHESSKYPDWRGAWSRFRVAGVAGQPSFDQTKSWGRGQQAPLTPEYRKVLEQSIADQAEGGQGNFFDHAVRCMPAGMPLLMVAFFPIEFIITPHTTYILIGEQNHYRRIFTDGRDWPKDIDPTYQGYSIGRWIDEAGGGTFDILEVETRGPFKGPRAYDATGLPLHFDNQSIFRERIYRDKANPRILHDEVTVIDHALTRPWTVDKRYVLDPNPRPNWAESNCTEANSFVAVGREMYAVSADGRLMPVKKGQKPPDLWYFNQTRK
jgi:hypothetical protein